MDFRAQSVGFSQGSSNNTQFREAEYAERQAMPSLGEHEMLPQRHNIDFILNPTNNKRIREIKTYENKKKSLKFENRGWKLGTSIPHDVRLLVLRLVFWLENRMETSVSRDEICV